MCSRLKVIALRETTSDKILRGNLNTNLNDFNPLALYLRPRLPVDVSSPLYQHREDLVVLVQHSNNQGRVPGAPLA